MSIYALYTMIDTPTIIVDITVTIAFAVVICIAITSTILHTMHTCTRIRSMYRWARAPQDSSKGGAVETGCSDLYAAIH